MALIEVKVNESVAAYRRVSFDVRDMSGLNPLLNEASGQPQISITGSPFQDGGIGKLIPIGNGGYYADLDPTVLTPAGIRIRTRYKSALSVETPGDMVFVTAYDPDSDLSAVKTAVSNIQNELDAVKADTAKITAFITKVEA